MPGIVSGGIGSGIDTNSLITQLVAAEGQPKYLKLDREEASAQSQIAAIGMLKGAVSDFQTKVSGIKDISDLDSKSTKISNKDYFSVSATSSAANASYSIEVKALAEAHKISSKSFSDTSAAIGTGTLTFQFGAYDSDGNTFSINPDQSTKTIIINEANNTLEGIRDAINKENIGLTASIIFDGTGNHLVLSSNTSGVANSIRVITSDDDGNNTDDAGLSQLSYDPTLTAGSGKNMTETVAAKDANITVDGINITSSKNTISDAIAGVTITLKKAEEGVKSTLTVSQDTTKAQAKVNLFVNAYNGLMEVLGQLTAFDADTKQKGPLYGDSTARSLESQINQFIGQVIPGLTNTFRALPELGVSTNADGSLSLDPTKLSKVIETDPDAVGRIIGSTGKTTDSQITFDSSTDKTEAGTYAINISQVATQGTLVGSAAANLTITTGVNDTLTFKIDDKDATITLTAGTYTASELAAEIQSRINSDSTLSENSIKAKVTESAGVLTVTSDSYGSDSSISITGGSGSTDIFGASPVSTDGLDVAGTINGISATGNGKFLTGSGSAAGLKN